MRFSWQAQGIVRLRGDGGDISWQVQYFVRVRRVDVARFVAGAGNREVVRCGRLQKSNQNSPLARQVQAKLKSSRQSRSKTHRFKGKLKQNSRSYGNQGSARSASFGRALRELLTSFGRRKLDKSSNRRLNAHELFTSFLRA